MYIADLISGEKLDRYPKIPTQSFISETFWTPWIYFSHLVIYYLHFSFNSFPWTHQTSTDSIGTSTNSLHCEPLWASFKGSVPRIANKYTICNESTSWQWPLGVWLEGQKFHSKCLACWEAEFLIEFGNKALCAWSDNSRRTLWKTLVYWVRDVSPCRCPKNTFSLIL